VFISDSIRTALKFKPSHSFSISQNAPKWHPAVHSRFTSRQNFHGGPSLPLLALFKMGANQLRVKMLSISLIDATNWLQMTKSDLAWQFSFHNSEQMSNWTIFFGQ
jgi:hypothetical protein